MEIMNRRTAAERGATIYWNGSPCGKGHTSGRYTSTGGCIQCQRDIAKGFAEVKASVKQANKEVDARNKQLDKEIFDRTRATQRLPISFTVHADDVETLRAIVGPIVESMNLERDRIRSAEIDAWKRSRGIPDAFPGAPVGVPIGAPLPADEEFWTPDRVARLETRPITSVPVPGSKFRA